MKPRSSRLLSPVSCLLSPGPRLAAAFTLIEMLVVVSIIAILMAILLPVTNTAIGRAKINKAETQVRLLENAWKAYYLEYNAWPENVVGYDGPDAEVTSTGIQVEEPMVRMLRGGSGSNVNGANPREKRFMEFPESSLDNGDFVDPWGNPYKFMLDYNYDGRLHIEFTSGGWSTDLYRKAAAWSRGPDEDDSNPNNTIPKSW